MSRILVLDRGNRALKAALVDAGRFEIILREEPGDDIETVMRAIESSAPEGIVFSSVVPGWADRFVRGASGLGVENVLEVGAGIHLPFDVCVDEPGRVGPDRLCGASGAMAHGYREAVIVDAGTAVTVDVLAGGAFQGGAIFPGLDILIRSLHENTAVLPELFRSGTAPDPPGRNTEEAILAGTFWGMVGAVNELVERSRSSLTGDAAVLVTGGNGRMLSNHLHCETSLLPDLVFKGLYHLYMLNNPAS